MKPILFFFFCAAIIFSCKKDRYITSRDAMLSTSADTLSFDTVFTSVGSVTQSFKIFNNNDEKLLLSEITLAGGVTSPFKINIDGTAATSVRDVRINANDSLYVFVQVNVDPNNNALPFILNDSIGIDYNGNKKWVQLQAYGQNAVFLKKQRITSTTSWDKKLPYVIVGGIQVDADATLTISQGTKIFLHADAPFLIDGTLKVNGTKEQPVVFAGDRLDSDYKDLPASWPGIYFRSSSKNNSLRHAIIRNSYQGIVAADMPSTSGPKVQLSQCIIDNIYDAGILGINSSINADNCLITNCGSNISLNGGNYRFINCTVASYNNNFISHKIPVLQISDTEAGNNSQAVNAFFQNCIFWGESDDVPDEVIVNKKGNEPFMVSFDHILYKAKNDLSNATISASVKNEPPQFDSINVAENYYDFHFTKKPSPALHSGIATQFPIDLDDQPRKLIPDIGCYEKQ